MAVVLPSGHPDANTALAPVARIVRVEREYLPSLWSSMARTRAAAWRQNKGLFSINGNLRLCSTNMQLAMWNNDEDVE